MTTFAAPGLDVKVPDPCKHVNYTLGMVLGVEDFNQDFGYTRAKLQLLAREAIGYGTLTGLRVGSDTTGKGPRVTVTSGAALLPPGQLVCVNTAQCGYVNDWLAAHKTEIQALLGSPLDSTLALYLTLCYRECPVDPVPIPGEPCRSEDELMAPSRLVDDFILELRTRPPDQREDDLLRELVAWMRALAFGGGGPYATVAAFVAALKASVQDGPQSPLASPPASPLSAPGVHFVFGSPLTSLKLDPALAGEYVRAAFRVWATEIRPKVHAACCASAHGCGCSETDAAPLPDECLLLARVNVPVVNIGGGEWRVDDTQTIAIDESRRPVLVSLRVLEEWMLAGGPGGGATGAAAGLVAAGIAGAGGVDGLIVGNLTVTVTAPSQIRVLFTGYTPPNGTFQYIVRAMALVAGGVGNPTIAFDSFTPGGILLRVTNGAAAIPAPALSGMRFMIDVTRVAA
jgi:hypothetical protein